MCRTLRWMVGAGLVIILAACGSSGKNDKDSAAPVPSATLAATVGSETGLYRTLTIDEFAGIVANNTGHYTIINVHIPYAGEIEGTDSNIPYNDLDALTAALPDKNAPIILYCRSGRMSEEASRALLSQGYTQVWDVPGGMNAWQASGRGLVDK